ncbi:hypothetical protein KAR91_78495 [Candidatus Pacearchaeota archaeon]|nr:hypothetical protein [Candidatus Pacearchaeota archaeon]
MAIYSYPSHALGMTFPVAVAMGQYPDCRIVKKFGSNLGVGTTKETIWDIGGLYEYLQAPTQLYIASTSPADSDTLKTGAFSVEVSGLDGNYDECDCPVKLDGQTPVPLEEDGLHYRVFKAEVAEAETALGAIGDIYIGYGTWSIGVPSNIIARITAPNNQTLMALYTVPKGHTAFLLDYYVTGGKGKELEIDSVIRNPGGVFRVVRKIGLLQGNFSYPNNLPFVLNEGDDVEVRGSTLQGETTVYSGFDMIVRKNKI